MIFYPVSMMNQSEEKSSWRSELASIVSLNEDQLLLLGRPVRILLEERRQKDLVHEFASLTTSESMSRYSGYNPTMCGMVWSMWELMSSSTSHPWMLWTEPRWNN